MSYWRTNLADLFKHPGVPALGAIVVLLALTFYLGRSSAPSANQELIQALTRADAEITRARAEADEAKRNADALRQEVYENAERISTIQRRAEQLDGAMRDSAASTETLRRNYATAKTARPRPLPPNTNLVAELDRLCARLAAVGKPCRD